MKQINVKKLLLPNIPYVFIALFATKLGQAARLAPGADFSQKALHIMEGFAAAFQSALPSFHPIDLCVGVAAALLIRLAVYVKGKNARKFRKNIEYGSARWGNAEDIKPYVDPTFANNVILTQTERLTMNSRPKDPKTARNKNVLVVGGSGSGKTRFFIKPNLMQLHSSYVVTDPKGSIVVECGKLLQRNQYKIKILNTINFKKSHHYNPFAYLHSEKDILKLVTTLIANTQGDGKSGDDFWRKAETLLYTALIGYIYYEAPVEEQNFATLIEMINTMEVREDDEDFKNPVDLMFEELAKREPHHFAVRQYAKYRLAAGKTAKSILISCGARLAPFDIQELREITAYDELELDTLGDRKTALFRRLQINYAQYIRDNRAFYSLDAGDGIEAEALNLPEQPDEALERMELERLLKDGLAQLTETQRRRLLASVLDKMTAVEIAAAESVSKASVGESINRAIVRLEKKLRDFF